MGDTTAIEWTDRTWNPTTGCTKISAGCDNCYAETIAERFRGHAAFPHGFDIQVRADKVNAPLSWRKPARVFVNSMSDLFHADIDQAWIADIFAVMAAAQKHTFQVLTKRHARMRTLLNDPGFIDNVHIRAIGKGLPADAWQWPLTNVWLGVSVENQQWADIRIPALINTPAAVRFLSCEPLLGPVWIDDHVWQACACCDGEGHDEACARCVDSRCESGHIRKLDWVIVGGESGRKARPAAQDWFRSLRDQCATANVPYFFKQHGEYRGFLMPGENGDGPHRDADLYVNVATGEALPEERVPTAGRWYGVWRVGKKAAGRELDGRTWDQFPEVA